MKKDQVVRGILIIGIFFLTFWFGIRPIVSGDEFERRMRKTGGMLGNNQYGLVVFGTEPEGIAAALCGARMGLKTLLITEDMDPGSYIKSGLIAYTAPDYAILHGEKIRLNAGIYTELFGDTGGNFSLNDYIQTVIKKIEKEPNLDVFYNAGFLSAETEEGRLKSVTVYHDGEKKKIEAPYFIDATENGEVLVLCEVPYYTGSGDIHVPDAYMPVQYHFIISNVEWKDIESLRKQNQYMDDFREVLAKYERFSEKTKISNLSFIGQPDSDMIISGIRMRQVNVDNPDDIAENLKDALTEARMLTAYLKVAFVPFEKCSFKTGATEFYIPEYRHFSGRYRLTVEDILENRNFVSKVVMASAPVDAEKFVGSRFSEEYTYILGNPKAYSIPLECFISQNLDNLMMVGKKSSFSSLAATSAGRMEVSISCGQAMGVTAAYCYLNDITPAELSESTDTMLEEYQNVLERTGITLLDFEEVNPNHGHWAWSSVKVLAEYGLLAGGMNNDYLFDTEAYQENLAILIINMIVKAVPEKYSLDFDTRLRNYAVKEPLTGEKACEIILEALNMKYSNGQAFNEAERLGMIPQEILDRLSPESPVTLDCVYALTVHLIQCMK